MAAIKSVGLVAGNLSAIKITLKNAVPVTDDYLLTITCLKDTKGLLVDGDTNGSVGGTLRAYIRKGVVTL